MPRRSTGCEKCRQRKVRCDEGKPRCNRCAEYGVACPGYRPPAERDLHFVDQTRHIARKSGSELTTASPDKTKHNIGTQFRWRNQFSGEIIQSGPIPMNNKNLHRVQLLSTFMGLYLPKRRDAKMMSHFAYITALPNVDLSTPLLQVAVDTVCLAELGSLYDDERCLQEARGAYVRALPMLKNELEKPASHQMPKDAILASITILALCELFDAIAKGNFGGQGWISHVQGAQQYIRAHGPEIISSPFGWLLFHNIRHGSLCMGLVRRKAVFFAERKWLKLTKSLSKSDAYVALYDIALQAPGLFERADMIKWSDQFDLEFIRLCTDLCRLREEFDGWEEYHHPKCGYNIVNIEEMEEFARLCDNGTFRSAFTFSAVQLCSQFQLYWITSLMLDFTIANLYRLYGKDRILPDLCLFTSRTKQDFWRSMYVNATNYCRSIPYCCEPETASAGRIGTFLLRITQSFLEIAGYTPELEWCKAVRTMLENSTVRPPSPTTKPNDKPSFKVTTPSSPAPLRLGGEYPNKTYNPRASREARLSYDPSRNAVNSSAHWCSRIPLAWREDVHTALQSFGDLDFLRPDATSLPSEDPLDVPLLVTGMPSDRLQRDLGDPPRYGRRWNVPPEVAREAEGAFGDTGTEWEFGMGGLGDLTLEPDGGARRGPVGAMCF
ncbi:hypothetical protein PRZ48_014805 [Zasmidium cellare]|uniref:Zn(2)-C6 fungal-type domain-containing protein n=1 Tax=Zasmidium cellare TaxID=395010 RepID=A0ABR0DZE0_ZASCE|nr:hypothetical protein PRZ48_014805 [Zasmidium cellare]